MAAVMFRSLCRGLSHIVVHGGSSSTSSSSTSSSVFCSNASSGGGGGIRHKSSSVQFASRPDLPALAYRRLKGKSPGVVFLPGYSSNMDGQKAEALEGFCRSAGHACVRFDYTGRGASEGAPPGGAGEAMATTTLGAWKKDVLFVLDELTDGPQILVGASMGGWLMLLAALARPDRAAALVGISTAADHPVTAFNALPLETRSEFEEKGEWTVATSEHSSSSSTEEGGGGTGGMRRYGMEFLREAEGHCVLQGPIPVLCPVRLLHGLKDQEVPWHVSLQVAERVLSPDVDVILRRHGEHRMVEQADIKLLLYTVEDLIDLTKS